MKHPTLLHIETWPPNGAIYTKGPAVATKNTNCGTAVQANSVTATLPTTNQTESDNTDHKLAIVAAVVNDGFS